MTMRQGRPRTAVPTVGLVVEGDAEFYALPKLREMTCVDSCPPLSVKNLRGLSGGMSARAIAQRASPHVVAHLVAGRDDVVLVVDLERRNDCPGDFAGQIRQSLIGELAAKGRACHTLAVVVANRSFEAWLLADASGLHSRGLFAIKPKRKSFEGTLTASGEVGKREVERLLGSEYRESVDAPRLFEGIDLHRARDFSRPGGSKSLDKLLRTLGATTVDTYPAGRPRRRGARPRRR